jgi:hypothetical protein
VEGQIQLHLRWEGLRMCPLCIGAATLIVSGGTSASALATVVVRRLGRKNAGERRAGRLFSSLRRRRNDGGVNG